MPPGNLKGGESPREWGAERVEERVEERVTASLEKFSTLANTTNIVDLTTRARSTDELKKFPRFDPKERASASRKRPRSGLPLVEDITTAELTNLIQEAVKTALKETNKELELLRKEVAGLQKRLSVRENSHSPQSSSSNTHALGKEKRSLSSTPAASPPADLTWAQRVGAELLPAPNDGGEWKIVSPRRTRKQAKEESDISPKDHTINAERRIIIKRKNENGPCPASDLVVAMNAALSKARAPPHIRVQKVETNEKGTVTACMGPKATGLMALKFKETLLKATKEVDISIEQMEANETWHKLKLHAVSLDRYYYPDDEELREKGLSQLKEDILNAYPELDLPLKPRWLLHPKKLRERANTASH
ncbi:hypothetical protein EX30DRAFT_351802 [Ascodesmis nigricans]|uniref:Uncharacterized protein n=1 Tax=Ascodesmis nigricans TaxID=341454 RepID=A0A4S2MKM2_9PEZI|nr:hypothetical protein EX30DRAFT_351802 [Ascodesmis nigricans]